MIATNDQCARQMQNRLKTTCMGLGLVRLLQDARRFDEAKATLYSLEGVPSMAKSAWKSEKSSLRRPGKKTAEVAA